MLLHVLLADRDVQLVEVELLHRVKEVVVLVLVLEVLVVVRRAGPCPLEDLLVLDLLGRVLFEFASDSVLLERVVEGHASALLLLELTLPVVGGLLEVVEVDWLE